MTVAFYVVAAAMVGVLLLGWLGGRLIESLRDRLAMGTNVVARFCLGTLVSLLAARAAQDGGDAWIAFGLLVACAAFIFALACGMLWVWATGRLDNTESAGSG